jgi:predicted Fe-Mo cluster-binding NifX family protein
MATRQSASGCKGLLPGVGAIVSTVVVLGATIWAITSAQEGASLAYGHEVPVSKKVVIGAEGNDLNSWVSPRFCRSRYFVVVDLVTGEIAAMRNPYAGNDRGAEMGTARMIAQAAGEGLITGRIHWDAYQVLKDRNTPIYAGVQGRAGDALEQYRAGLLTALGVPAGSAASPGASQVARVPVPGMGRMGGFGLGPSGYMTCPRCGYTTVHQRGVPAVTVACPRCGTPLMRQDLLQDTAAGASAQPVAQPGAAPPIVEGQAAPSILKEFGIEVVGATGGGVHVTGVMGNSHAQAGGLRAGDIILAVNGQRLTTVREFKRLVNQAAPESNARIKALRNGRAKSLLVMVGEGEMEGFTPIVR